MDFNDAIKAHSDWKMKLRGAISAQSQLDADTIAKDNCCVLGKWLHGESKLRYSKFPAFQECLKSHAAFHQEAGKVAWTINQGQYAAASKMLESGSPYIGVSNAVVIAIGALKRQASL
jgi:Chemoreceptor zinc-binding domain